MPRSKSTPPPPWSYEYFCHTVCGISLQQRCRQYGAAVQRVRRNQQVKQKQGQVQPTTPREIPLQRRPFAEDGVEQQTDQHEWHMDKGARNQNFDSVPRIAGMLRIGQPAEGPQNDAIGLAAESSTHGDVCPFVNENG